MKFRRRKPAPIDVKPGSEIEVKDGLGHTRRFVVMSVTFDRDALSIDLLTPKAAQARPRGFRHAQPLEGRRGV